MSIGERLKNLRVSAQKTLKEQSEIFGVSINSIYRWEHDLTTPRKSSFEKLAQFYEVPIGWLLTGSCADERMTAQDAEDEERLLRMYRRLSRNNKYKVLGYVERVYIENMDDQSNINIKPESDF